MRERGDKLRHRVPHNQPTTYVAQHLVVVHGVTKGHTVLHRQPQMIAQHRQRGSFVTAHRQHFKTVHRREGQVRPFAQRLVKLNTQTAEIVVIATEADLGHLVCRNAAQIDKLIFKAAVNVSVQQGRDLTPGKPAFIIKNMHAGLRIPGAVQDNVRHLRIQILTVQHIAVDGVNARSVAGDQERIEGKCPQQMAHLQHMTTSSKRQGNFTLAQALKSVQGFLP